MAVTVPIARPDFVQKVACEVAQPATIRTDHMGKLAIAKLLLEMATPGPSEFIADARSVAEALASNKPAAIAVGTTLTTTKTTLRPFPWTLKSTR